MTSLARFIQTFDTAPDRVALIDATRPGEADLELTAAGLSAAARCVSAELAARGVGVGDRVALLMGNGVDLALLYLACLHRGATAVPISPEQPADLRTYMLELTRPTLAVTDREVDTAGLPVWRLAGPRSLPGLGRAPSDDPWQPDPSLPLLIAFTSGTTSRPKGVCHAAGGMIANVQAFNAATGLGADTRLLHVMPMTYMAGFLNTLLSPLAAGGSVVLAPAFDAATALSFWLPAKRHAINTVWLSPTMAALLTRVNRDPAMAEWGRAHLRRVFMGTAPLPAKVRDEFGAAFSCTPLESWGMTEVLLGTVVPPEDPRDATVGRMIGGVSIVSRDDGELWVKSAYALLGYLDTDGAVGPNGADAEGWFPTGDLGGVDADGMVVISGRKKDLIIHGGTNVSPRAVEETLLQDPGVLDSAVVGVKHAFWGEEVVACLQLAPHVALADIEARLKELCRTRLPADAVPARFVAFAEFPRSSTGKVQKRGLLERL